VQYLKGTSPRVAVIGFCMGGVLSILAAVYAKETDAAVSWYGVPPQEAADTGTIKIAIQGHFALEDEHFTPAQVDALESRLKEGKVNYEFYRYQAQHGFGNETGVSNENRHSLTIRIAMHVGHATVLSEPEANSLMGCLRARLHALTKRIQSPCMSQQ